MPLERAIIPSEISSPVLQDTVHTWIQDEPPTAVNKFDRWYRPDSGRHYLWRHNVSQPSGNSVGHWVTQESFFMHFESAAVSANSNVGRSSFFYLGLNIPADIYLERVMLSARVTAGNTDNTNYWTANFERAGAGAVDNMHSAALKTLSTTSAAFNYAPNKRIDELGNTTQLVYVRLAKTGTPANLVFGADYQYRLIHT